MSLLFIDGMDLYGNNADLQAAGWSLVGPSGISVDLSGGRHGNGSIKIKGGSNINRPIVTGAVPVLIVSFAAKIDSLAHAVDEKILEFYTNSGVDLVSYYTINTTGQLVGKDFNDTTVDSSPVGTVKEGVWQFFEFKTIISNSSGVIQAKVNEDLVVDATGLDTKPGTEEIFDKFVIHGASDDSSFGVTIDDIHAIDSAGAYWDDYIGDSTVDTLLPNSDDATDAAWLSFPSQVAGSEYLNIDDPEPGSDDGDSTYNYSNSPADDSLYGFDDLSNTPQQIFAVQLSLSARKSDAGTRTVKHLFKGDTKIAEAAFSPNTSYELHRKIRERSADSSPVAWTKSKVDTLLAGMRMDS